MAEGEPDKITFVTSSGSSYDSYRPSYPPNAVTSLLSSMHLTGTEGNGARVLDLAAGTGKFTELLAAREEGYEILAVEPYGEMRETLKGKGLQGVTVLDGSAEKISGVESESCDGVVVAQAFHWFANRQALEEIYRVLVPGGVLGMIWNIEDSVSPPDWPTTTAYESRLKDIVYSKPYEDGYPTQFRTLKWRDVFDEQLKSTPLTVPAADPLFSLPLGEAKEPYARWIMKEDLWRNWETKSQVARLDRERKEALKQKFDAVFDADDVERNEKGEIAFHWQTHWVWTSKIPGGSLKEGG